MTLKGCKEWQWYFNWRAETESWLWENTLLPGSPLLPYGLWGVPPELAGLGTLLRGDPGFWEPCIPVELKPIDEYDTLWGIAGSGICWKGKREWPGANSLCLGTSTGGKTVIESKVENHYKIPNSNLEVSQLIAHQDFPPSCNGKDWYKLPFVWLRMGTDKALRVSVRDVTEGLATAILGSKWHGVVPSDEIPVENRQGD